MRQLGAFVQEKTKESIIDAKIRGFSKVRLEVAEDGTLRILKK